MMPAITGRGAACASSRARFASASDRRFRPPGANRAKLPPRHSCGSRLMRDQASPHWLRIRRPRSDNDRQTLSAAFRVAAIHGGRIMVHPLWRVCVGVLLGSLATAGVHGEEAMGATTGPDAAFRALADDYFDNYYLPTNPSTATSLGVHRYDDQFEDLSHAALLRDIATLKQYATRVAAVDPVALSEPVRADRALLLAS